MPRSTVWKIPLTASVWTVIEMARPFIPWVGGKEKLIPNICRILPPNTSQYLEPFGGGGALLLHLEPKSSRLDIYNDFNSDLVNLFLCVKEKTNVLMRELGYLPLHSRKEFELYKDFLTHEQQYRKNIAEEIEVLQDRACFTQEEAAELLPIFQERAQLHDVMRAVAYCKRAWGSFSGTTTSFGVKTLDMERILQRIRDASGRLKDVVIENKDAVTLIRERDRVDGTIYCDPPYYQAEKSYEAFFAKRAHVRLWKALKECRGYVIVSYNDCKYIRNLYKDFFILTFDRPNSMAQRAGARYGELLITNYDPRQFVGQLDLFGEYSGLGNMRLVRIPKKPLKTIPGGIQYELC